MLHTHCISTKIRPVASHFKQKQKFIIAKGDSGATHHYWRSQDTSCIRNETDIIGPAVRLPNNTTIQVTRQGQLPLAPALSNRAKKVMILPSLKSSSLISLGQLCDDDCHIILDKTHLTAVKNDNIILQGVRNPTDGLWDIPVHKTKMTSHNFQLPHTNAGMYKSAKKLITSPVKQEKIKAPARHKIHPDFQSLNYLIDHNICDDQISRQISNDKKSFRSVSISPRTNSLNVIIHKKKTHLELAQYLHAACYSPVKSTFQRAIKNGHFAAWPGLTVDIIQNHLPRSVATVQGHLHQERQGLQTTKQTPQSTLTQIKTMQQIRKKFNSLKKKMQPGQSMEETLLQENQNPIEKEKNGGTEEDHHEELLTST